MEPNGTIMEPTWNQMEPTMEGMEPTWNPNETNIAKYEPILRHMNPTHVLPSNDSWKNGSLLPGKETGTTVTNISSDCVTYFETNAVVPSLDLAKTTVPPLIPLPGAAVY